VRTARYQEIADELRSRVVAGEFAGGRLLPSEADLCAAYAASRVTVRRALEQLRDEGLITARQGFGWYVAGDPLQQSLGKLRTIEAQLHEAGIESERRILDFRFVAAPARVRAALHTTRVLEVRRVNLADGKPFARVTVWCPEVMGRDLSLADVERSSFADVLDVEFGTATQTIAAAAASAPDAELLAIEAGSPVLSCRRVTVDVTGRPVLMSEHVFPAHSTEFVVELTRADHSIAPSGLQLIRGRRRA
jgi:GntR family transcriptional regulator